MKAAVITFPASNCDRDLIETLARVTGKKPHVVWHADSSLPDSLDLIALPGGFSYGDYLRSGAMAARSPIMQEVVRRAEQGVRVLGICNGFQILTESGLLPGTLMRNRDLKFLCRTVSLRVENTATDFTRGYTQGSTIRIPIAHHDGNYFADADTLKQLEDQNQIAFRYCDDAGNSTNAANPNGSQHHIAGILNARGTVLGMMPHPERAAEKAVGNVDGLALFESLLRSLA